MIQILCLKTLQQSLVYFKFSYLFRDNGITIQIMIYQLYCELTIFLLILISIVVWNESTSVQKIIGCLINLLIFVVQPLFYLNGDVNFRNRVQNQGLWKALKKELFQTNSRIQPISVSWFIPKFKFSKFLPGNTK